MENSTNIGQKVKSIRESKSFSQEQLAQGSGLTIDQIAHIEDNQNLPSLAPLIKIAASWVFGWALFWMIAKTLALWSATRAINQKGSVFPAKRPIHTTT